MAIVVIDVEDEIGTEYLEVPEEELVAGQLAPAGVYEEIESRRIIRLARASLLPASCDGHVAVYVLRSPKWGDVVQQRPQSRAERPIDLVETRAILSTGRQRAAGRGGKPEIHRNKLAV